jgi:hypothetical protein
MVQYINSLKKKSVNVGSVTLVQVLQTRMRKSRHRGPWNIWKLQGGGARLLVWAAITDRIPTGGGGDLPQKCKELLRKTQAGDLEGSRANCLKLYSEVVCHTYCSKLFS